jgi:hypothetical protein
MPTVVKDTPEHVPPSRRQVQAAVEPLLLSGHGSLNKSKMTAELFLKVFATDVQNAGEWSKSGIGCKPVAMLDPAAFHCKSRIEAMPF